MQLTLNKAYIRVDNGRHHAKTEFNDNFFHTFPGATPKTQNIKDHWLVADNCLPGT